MFTWFLKFWNRRSEEEKRLQTDEGLQNLYKKLRTAARAEEKTAVWAPGCLEPDTLIELSGPGGCATKKQRAAMSHVVTCGYCRCKFSELADRSRPTGKAVSMGDKTR